MSKNRQEGIIVVSDGKPGGISEIYQKYAKNDLRVLRVGQAKSHGLTVSDCDVTKGKGRSKGKAGK